MTLRELLEIVARRWYVPLAALALAVAMFFAMLGDGGIYTTRTVVTFRLASSSMLAADNGSESESVIAFAGTIVTMINNGRPAEKYSSSDAPYYGAGVRQGVMVGLRDDGSQWERSFDSAVIEIQIVGRTRGWVARQQESILARVDRMAEAQQETVGNPDRFITTDVEPLTKKIDFIAPSRSTEAAAAGALFLAAGIVGGWGAVMIDRYRAHRRRAARDLSPEGVVV